MRKVVIWSLSESQSQFFPSADFGSSLFAIRLFNMKCPIIASLVLFIISKLEGLFKPRSSQIFGFATSSESAVYSSKKMFFLPLSFGYK